MALWWGVSQNRGSDVVAVVTCGRLRAKPRASYFTSANVVDGERDLTTLPHQTLSTLPSSLATTLKVLN